MSVVFESRDKMSQSGSLDSKANTSTYFRLIEALLRGAISDAEHEMGDMISSYMELDAEFQSLKSRLPEEDFLKFEHYFARLLENMQFFDSLSQRVDHVAKAIAELGEHRGDKLCVEIKKSYTTAAEHQLHENFMNSESNTDPRVRSLGE